MAKCFSKMQQTCIDHSEGKPLKVKCADATGAKHKTKSVAKEEAKLGKQENVGAAISPAKAKAEAKTLKQQAKEEKKLKKEAKQNGIKKPLSAYILYCNHRRPIIMKESPGKNS